MDNRDFGNYDTQRQLSESEAAKIERRRRNLNVFRAVAIVMAAVLVVGFLVKIAWLMIAAFVIFLILEGIKALHDSKNSMNREVYNDLLTIAIVAIVFVVLLVAMFH